MLSDVDSLSEGPPFVVPGIAPCVNKASNEKLLFTGWWRQLLLEFLKEFLTEKQLWFNFDKLLMSECTFRTVILKMKKGATPVTIFFYPVSFAVFSYLFLVLFIHTFSFVLVILRQHFVSRYLFSRSHTLLFDAFYMFWHNTVVTIFDNYLTLVSI